MSEHRPPRPAPPERSRPAPTSTSADVLAAGRYVLGPPLGTGGMGVVRRAHDRRLDRTVAVKLLADNLAADPIARERFLREARAAAAISDPHVVTVHDVGDETDRPYLVMELVDGPSLAEVVRREGAQPGERVREIAADALAGLAAIHAAGIVHRDVKPANLLVAPDGRVKLGDLGVAGAADGADLTRTGFVVGTGSYLAPERRAGAQATPTTDLYALGVTLVELLAGQQVRYPATWARGATWLPDGLQPLLQDLLAEDPAERPDSAASARAGLVATDAPPASRSNGEHPRPDTAALPPTVAAEAHTQLLPVDEGPTAPHDGAPAANRTRTYPPGQEATPSVTPGPDGTQDDATLPDAATTRPAASWRWWLATVTAVTLVAVITIGALVGGDDPVGAEEPAADPVDQGSTLEDPDTVPSGGDPATTARNLAEWLRSR